MGQVTPLPANTDIAEVIASKLFNRILMFDANGADAMGLVTASPAAFSFLGRLKAIGDNTAALSPFVDGLEGLIGLLNGYVDGFEALVGSTNSALSTQAEYLDGLETLIGTTNTLLTTLGSYEDDQEGLLGQFKTLLQTQATYLDGVEALLGTNNDANSLMTPADDIFPITPNDMTNLAQVPKALYCSVAGNVAVQGASGNTRTIPMTAGQTLPLRARRVLATNTTATVFGLA